MTTYGSVCSGVESASVAWGPLGMEPLWFSEIEKFPSAVLSHRWPKVPNLGDMAILPELIRVGRVVPPSILVGGTPCQAFSVAGKRAGLEDDRGQLTLKYVEIANEIDFKRPGDECVALWENVPGVLSSKDNAFGCFLGELAGESCALQPPGGKWPNAGFVFGPKRSIAWRILDAQYFGVAQRRRRVFVVASARKGFDPCKVLFESEGVRRDTPPSRGTGSSVAALIASGVGTCGADDNRGQAGHLIPYSMTGAGFWREGAGTLRGREQDSHENLLCMAHGQGGAEIVSDGDPSLTCNPEASLIAFQLNAMPAQMDFNEDTIPTLTCSRNPAVCFSSNGNGSVNTAPHAYALNAGNLGNNTNMVLDPGPALCFQQNGSGELRTSEVAYTLNTDSNASGRNTGMVRRLLPVEYERLQGFPDNHTQIPWRGKLPKDCPDGPRYKAIGNSKAVPVVRWLGQRILKELNT